MHVPINLKSPNNISEWQKGFNSAFKGLKIFMSQICFLTIWYVQPAELHGGFHMSLLPVAMEG